MKARSLITIGQLPVTASSPMNACSTRLRWGPRFLDIVIVGIALPQPCVAMAPDYVGIGNLLVLGLGLLVLVLLGIAAFISLIYKDRWGHVKLSLGTGLTIAVFAEVLMHSLIERLCANPLAYPQCESDWYSQVFFIPFIVGTFLCSLVAWFHAIRHPQTNHSAKHE